MSLFPDPKTLTNIELFEELETIVSTMDEFIECEDARLKYMYFRYVYDCLDEVDRRKQ